MTQQQYIINRKLNILELSEKLKNISQACRNLKVSRQHYYDIKKTLEEEGIDALVEKSKSAPRLANRVESSIEEQVLKFAHNKPTYGQLRVSNELKKINLSISPGGVRSVWLRHKLQTVKLRLEKLSEWSRDKNNILNDSQIEALELAKKEKEAHGEIETHFPGYLLGQDTYYVGYIKGVGNIYQQTGIDTYSNIGFAKLYLEKTALTAADFLNTKVLPFFDSEQMKTVRVLTDRGTEYCGSIETHPFQLFLYLNNIEHTKTKARHPQTNGCTEKLNQIIQNEFYSVAFRKKVYTTLEEIQNDLDSYMNEYNNERTNQGKRCLGRTPMQTFEQGFEDYKKFTYQ